MLIISALAQLLSTDIIVWILLMGRSLCALLFALAAFIPRRRLRRPGLTLAALVAGVSAVVLLTAMMINWFAGHVTHHLAVTLAPSLPEGPGPGGHLALLTLQLAATVLYGMATIGFLRRARGSGDEFLGWLAISGIFAALSHLNYSLYPSPYAPLVHVGDIFRFCFYMTLLVASVRKISSYWQGRPKAAVLQERQRIAREAVANAARHSGARQVKHTLQRDDPRLRLRVSDQGQGFDPAVTCDGFGLISMRERARSVGGELRISSVPGVGCEVEAAV